MIFQASKGNLKILFSWERFFLGSLDAQRHAQDTSAISSNPTLGMETRTRK